MFLSNLHKFARNLQPPLLRYLLSLSDEWAHHPATRGSVPELPSSRERRRGSPGGSEKDRQGRQKQGRRNYVLCCCPVCSKSGSRTILGGRACLPMPRNVSPVCANPVSFLPIRRRIPATGSEAKADSDLGSVGLTARPGPAIHTWRDLF